MFFSIVHQLMNIVNNFFTKSTMTYFIRILWTFFTISSADEDCGPFSPNQHANEGVDLHQLMKIVAKQCTRNLMVMD